MWTRVSRVALLALVVLVPGYLPSLSGRTMVSAQEKGTQAPATPDSTAPAGMMQRHQQMMAEMKAADARLDQLVSDMNSATGDAKVTAIARVVSELVNQHKVMHGRMGAMDGQMMMMGRGMRGGK